MQKIFVSTLALFAAVVLSACGSNDSTSRDNSRVEAHSIRTEKVTCNETYVYTIRNMQSATDTKYIDESVSITNQTVTELSNGTEKIEKKGDSSNITYRFVDESTKVFHDKFGFTFVSTHEVEKSKTADSLVKEIRKIQGVQTGKDGYEFADSDGKKSPTRTYNDTLETITKIDGETSTVVSKKFNGKEQKVYDYVTHERVDGTTKSTRTTLRTPYTESFNDAQLEIMFEKSDSLCITEVIK